MGPNHLNQAIVYFLVYLHHRNYFLSALVVRGSYVPRSKMLLLCLCFVCMILRRRACRSFPRSGFKKKENSELSLRILFFLYTNFEIHTFMPLSLSTARCVAEASHLFPANTLTTSGAAFYMKNEQFIYFSYLPSLPLHTLFFRKSLIFGLTS